MEPLNILTWHVHGNYLYNLAQVPHTFYLPVKDGRPEGYGGRLPGFDWPDNLVDVQAEHVKDLDIDVVLFQSHKNYLVDQHEILSETQRRLPRVHLEHDPPRGHPTDTRHPVDDPDALIVHVTDFNDLMWDSGRTPTHVVDHGVVMPGDVEYSGELARGLVVVNGMPRRGRLAGRDLFERARERVPLDLVGMNSKEMGGLGEVPHDELPAFEARYRFFFNPIRYTSLGLAVCEAMYVGLPMLGMATTEMVTAVENGVSGYVDTNIDRLIGHMAELIDDPAEARRLSDGARRTGRTRFHIDRFVDDWMDVFEMVTGD